MYNLDFWKDAGERAVKTFAQTIVAVIGVDAVGITTLDWGNILSIAATAAVLSVLTSLASDKLGSQPGPSIVKPDTGFPVYPLTGPTIDATLPGVEGDNWDGEKLGVPVEGEK